MKEGFRTYRTSRSDVPQPGRSARWMERCRAFEGAVVDASGGDLNHRGGGMVGVGCWS